MHRFDLNRDEATHIGFGYGAPSRGWSSTPVAGGLLFGYT